MKNIERRTKAAGRNPALRKPSRSDLIAHATYPRQALPGELASILGAVRLAADNNGFGVLQADVRNITSDTAWATPISIDGSAVSETMAALLVFSRSNNTVTFTVVSRYSDDRSKLVEDVAVVWFDAAIATVDILIVDSDDGILGNVFQSVGLRVWVWYVRILIVIIPPVVGAGELGTIGTEKIKRVAGLVHEHVDHVIDGAEEDDVAVRVVGIAVSAGDSNHVPDPLAHLNGELAELRSH